MLIEIKFERISSQVALLAEGVDRNSKSPVCNTESAGRPPRGGRG